MSGDDRARRYVAAFLSRPTDPVLSLFAGEAAYDDGAEEVAVAIWSLGEAADPNLLRLESDQHASEEARKISAIANTVFRKWFTRLHVEAIDDYSRHWGVKTPRIREAIWPFTNDGVVDFPNHLHRPVVFYAPSLPANPMNQSQNSLGRRLWNRRGVKYLKNLIAPSPAECR